jgi:hypothetical protein
MGVVRVGALARRTRLRARQVAAVVAVASLVSAGSKVAQAADSNAQAQANSGDAINQALLKKIEALEQRIKSLEARDKQQSTTADTTGSVKPQNKSGKHDESPAAATEPATAQAQNKAGKANTASTLDKQTDDSKAAKQPADGKAAKPADDGKNYQTGRGRQSSQAGPTAEIEQVWIDFKFSDPISWRAPGVDLVPIGYINQHHEPTQFYSVLRPELYNGLIPSTWKVPATSIYGTIVDGVKYQLMLSMANEDFGDAFDLRTPGGSVPPGPYFPGVDGLNALAFSNPPLGDFAQLNNSPAISGRVDFALPFTPGLAWSVSAYFAPNIEPRGAHGDLGNPLGQTSMGVYDAEFRYRIPQTWVELRGEGVFVTFGNPANLRANNDSDPTNNVGKTMYGFSGEFDLHVPMGTILNTEWEAVPFYRYTNQNFQTAGFAGTDANMPTGAGQTQFHNVGVAIFPSPKVVLKATYQKVINKDPAGANADSVLGGVGFFF